MRNRAQPSIAVLRTHSIQQSTDVDSSSLTSHQAATASGAGAGGGDGCLSDAGDDARSRECDETEPLNGGQLLRQKLMDTKANVGYRLGRRKALTERRKLASDLALVCGLAGLAVMILETELYMADVYTKVRPVILYILECNDGPRQICTVAWHFSPSTKDTFVLCLISGTI